MPITADHIRTTLAEYADAHPEDKHALAPLAELLDQDADVTSRKEFRGHVTAGAVLVNDRGEALFIHHNALDKWLTPGGHLEPEDVNLLGAALRELVEETGVTLSLAPVQATPVHIDVHPIPANDAKGEGAHWHADFRYVFRATGDQAVTLQEEEVSGYAWRSVDTIADETLRARVVAALR
ncbi:MULTISPECIES: NUDIX hydrolase [unclassified Streptomyces]|uniref:NUDIX hydrolase n=1 Tax=unclassified Streptomyces TaxID=2593676 RepID=UPI000DC7BDFA|nr:MULTISPECIES: NUDIX hydrolase [unclassified Streptomyces]AWZ07314.1 NUDIX hydrolase [Streptomyces sp. ICC4]AWZ13772.1 NUDIX hydrolase [Streptomyces sp. ICC1]